MVFIFLCSVAPCHPISVIAHVYNIIIEFCFSPLNVSEPMLRLLLLKLFYVMQDLFVISLPSQPKLPFFLEHRCTRTHRPTVAVQIRSPQGAFCCSDALWSNTAGFHMLLCLASKGARHRDAG